MSLDAKILVEEDVVLIKVQHHRRPSIKFKACLFNVKINGVESMSIQAGQKVGLSIHPQDAFGNAARLDGIASWASSNEAVLALTVAEDGLSAVATSVGPVGTAVISVSADADLDAGEVRLLTGEVSIEVVAGEAVDLNETVEPIVIAIAPAPAVETTTEAPVAEVVTEAPAVETTTEAPVAEVVTEAPAVETTTEAPAVETTTEAPAVETTTEAPVDQQQV